MRISIAAAGRTIALAFSLAALSACATQPARTAIKLDDPSQIRALFDSLEAVRLERVVVEGRRDGGPRLELSTDAMYTNRVNASFRLEDDAYVAAFNVARDGRVTMIYPESPEDPTLLRAGHTYRLPEFFPGYSRRGSAGYAMTSTTSRSVDDGGYVFVVASWSPLRIDRLEELELLDSYRQASYSAMQPYNVMHEYADLLVPRGNNWYTVKYRYYGEQGGSLFANTRSCGYGYGGFSANAQLLSSFLGRSNYSPFLMASILNDLAMEGCGSDALARHYLFALMSGFGRPNSARPNFPQVPLPPSTPPAGGDSLTPGAGSQPAPPEQKPRDRGERPRLGDCADDKGDPCEVPTRQPRRADADGEDDAIELGGRRRGDGTNEDRRGVRSWGARADRDLPMTDGPRTYRSPRPGRMDEASTGRPVPAPRVDRPRSEPRVEQPRAEPVRQAPPPRVERSEPPPPRIERSEPAPSPRIERTEAPRPKPVESPVQP